MTSDGFKSTSSITFKLKPYYSYLDEKSFFTWLESIEGIVTVKGGSGGLSVKFDRPFLSRAGAYDLIALFSRYGYPLASLRPLIDPVDIDYFRDPGNYWSSELFAENQADE